MRYLTIIYIVVAAFLAVYLWPRHHESGFVGLGNIPVIVSVDSRSEIRFRGDVLTARIEMSRMENIFSAHLPGSEISKLNDEGAHGVVAVSDALKDVLKSSRSWYELSGGAFDPSVGPTIALWKGAAGRKEIPSRGEILKAKANVGFDKVDISDDGVKFKREGMRLDLGAIAKGTILDAIALKLQRRGVDSGFVDAGGDMRLFGDKEFIIGIKDPSRDAAIARLSCRNAGVVTSGNYARYSEIAGKRYSHIIDPHTGWPLTDALYSVTAVAPNAEDADALATALMVMGVKDGKELVRKLGDEYGAVFVNARDDSKRVDDFLQGSGCVIKY